MIADLALTLVGWVAGITAVLAGGTLMLAWMAGLLNTNEPGGPASTDSKDRST